MENQQHEYSAAINDFYRARNQAQIQEIIARLRGSSNQLLNYDEVRKRLRAQGSMDRGLKDIPIHAIVGSLGRYNDFTRDFLPKKDTIKDRWARVRLALSGMTGLPPIEVYQIGDVYFVKDGNHRVSVARQLGMDTIQAYVTEVHSRVPLTPDITPDTLIISEEYLRFLDHTHLDQRFPGLDLRMTIPGMYRLLEEHISVHQYFMGLDEKRTVTFPEAAAHWYTNYYLPIIQKIEELGILRNYPNRTSADLYVFLSENISSIERRFGLQIRSERAILTLLDQKRKDLHQLLRDIFETLDIFLFGGKFSSGPPPGEWRTTTSILFSNSNLIQDILVPIDGQEGGWLAVRQALLIAQKENASIHALHLVENNITEIENSLKQQFENCFSDASPPHDLILRSGNIADTICNYSRFFDLVVLNLRFPPGPLPLDRLTSGFHELIQRCPRPILAVPQTVSKLSKGLLAYAAGPKSREALYFATYLAQKWSVSITVLSVEDKHNQAVKNLAIARKHLSYRNVKAEYLTRSTPVASAILETAAERQCDFIIIGGYGYNPFREIMIGSVVDEILRATSIPLLICR